MRFEDDATTRFDAVIGKRQYLLVSLLLVVACCAMAFAFIRSPFRGVFGVLAGLALCVYFVLRKPQRKPLRWFDLLVSIAVIQALAIVLFWAFARFIARIVG